MIFHLYWLKIASGFVSDYSPLLPPKWDVPFPLDLDENRDIHWTVLNIDVVTEEHSACWASIRKYPSSFFMKLLWILTSYMNKSQCLLFSFSTRFILYLYTFSENYYIDWIMQCFSAQTIEPNFRIRLLVVKNVTFTIQFCSFFNYFILRFKY